MNAGQLPFRRGCLLTRRLPPLLHSTKDSRLGILGAKVLMHSRES
jgi:hypothetical protein